MKVWITKYALSAGIKESSGEVMRTGLHGGLVNVAGHCWLLKLGSDAHETKEAAIAAAEAMRAKKIASLKKQIAKLEKMTFDDATATHSTDRT